MSIVSSIFDIFSNISSWIVHNMESLSHMFYDASNNQLTFFGALAVCGLGFSVIFLLVGLIQRFLHFRG